jgi:hypothetical protein
MKKIISVALLFLAASLTFADINIGFFGNNNFTIDANTTFAANIDNGATGLLTEMGVGLWFEITPYSDRNIPPQRDALSVSLKLANSAFYAWRGYDDVITGSVDGATLPSNYGGMNQDQATSIWFNTFIADLEYNNRYWIRIAGLEPELTVSQASIRSVFDPIMSNRTDVDKNKLPMPLFHGDGNHYNNKGGVVGIINRDIIHLNRREVVVAGNLFGGIRGEDFDLTLKTGSWLKAEENTLNSWVAGADFTWRPDMSNLINFSLLTAANYGKVTMSKDDPMANPSALAENPIAAGLGYEYRIELPGNMVIRPYAGFDFIYETTSDEYNFEFGGGLQWFLRGTNASLKRNDKVGGVSFGDVALPAAFVMGLNVDKNGFMNAIVSFNEDPRSSPLPNLGGYIQAEFMNINGNEYLAPDGNYYNEFMFAGIGQIEYLVTDKVMPYIHGKFIPADTRGLAAIDAPVYRKNRTSLTSKLGVRLTPLNYFSVDVWYERTDVRVIRDWILDNGTISVTFAMRSYF